MNGPNITGKHRASRIPLEYYKHGDGMTRRKKFWTLLALWLTLGWCLVLIPAMLLPATKSTPLAEERYSHGPVCRAHKAIGHECSACHVNFPMLGSRDDIKDILSGARSTFAGDRKCLMCHLSGPGDDKGMGALAVHHPGMKASMTPNCGTCHQDHKGTDHDLKRVADASCTGCHKNLNESLEGMKSVYANVSSFSGDHPVFRSTKTDPSKIKFNHAYHMTDGIVLARGGKPFTIRDMADGGDGQLKAAVTARVRGNATAGVKLDCTDCHKPDNRDDRAWSGAAPVADISEAGKKESREAFAAKRENRGRVAGTGELLPPSSPGAYFGAIKYEDHCAACHSTTIAPNLPPVKHGTQPEELLADVTRLIASDGGSSSAPKPWSSFFPLPGKSPQKGTADVKTQIDMAMRSLLEGKRTCGECHVGEDGSDLSVNTKRIAKPDIPRIWMTHGRFDHSQHGEARSMKCADCHDQAYKNDEKAVLKAYAMPRKGAEMVMLPGIDNCKQCHSPSPTKSPAARHDCTECHSYHHGTAPGSGNQRAGVRPGELLLRGLRD
jgi:hypothetical protein